MKRGTQRTLFDFHLPGASTKRSRLSSEDSSRTEAGGCQDDDEALSNSASTSIDTSTASADQVLRASTSTGQDTDTSKITGDHETDSSMNEGTTSIATSPASPNDIANTRDCEPVRPILKQFPKRMICGKLRGFSCQWYALYPFVEYSVQMDAVFCYACRRFPPPLVHTEEVFIKTGFRNWKKIGEKLQKHTQSEFHKHSVALWGAYQQAKACGSIAEQLDSQLSTVIQSNRKFLKTIAQVVILCARQNMALRSLVSKKHLKIRVTF